jgi:hypothetical protein
MIEIKEFIDKYAALLPVGNSISSTEAERRAGDFLVAQAKVTDVRHLLSQEKIKLLSIQTATFASEVAKCAGKTITENKLLAEASEAYIKARESLDAIESDVSYLRAYYDIFKDAHVYYRQMSRGENL